MTSPLETGSLNKVATITEAMLHSETASTVSSESAFNKDHEEIRYHSCIHTRLSSGFKEKHN